MKVLDLQTGAVSFDGRERLFEATDIEPGQRHAEHRLHAADAAQLPEGFDLAVVAAFDAANLIVERTVAVETDGDHQVRQPPGDRPGDGDDAVGEETVG